MDDHTHCVRPDLVDQDLDRLVHIHRVGLIGKTDYIRDNRSADMANGTPDVVGTLTHIAMVLDTGAVGDTADADTGRETVSESFDVRQSWVIWHHSVHLEVQLGSDWP